MKARSLGVLLSVAAGAAMARAAISPGAIGGPSSLFPPPTGPTTLPASKLPSPPPPATQPAPPPTSQPVPPPTSQPAPPPGHSARALSAASYHTTNNPARAAASSAAADNRPHFRHARRSTAATPN